MAASDQHSRLARPRDRLQSVAAAVSLGPVGPLLGQIDLERSRQDNGPCRRRG